MKSAICGMVLFGVVVAFMATGSAGGNTQYGYSGVDVFTCSGYQQTPIVQYQQVQYQQAPVVQYQYQVPMVQYQPMQYTYSNGYSSCASAGYSSCASSGYSSCASSGYSSRGYQRRGGLLSFRFGR